MRVTAAVLCSLLLGVAGYAVGLWAETPWPIAGIALALTPMVTFTTALAAPNGVEIAGGLGLWASLIGLTRTGDQALERRLLLTATISAIPLIGVRTLGPLWLIMILLTCLALGWGATLAQKLRGHSWLGTACSTVIGVTFAAAAMWTLKAQPNSPSQAILPAMHAPLTTSLRQIPVWILQSVGAFPSRDHAAPAVVYGIEFSAFLAMLLISFRFGSRRFRVVLALALAASILVPLALTLGTYAQLGAIWQGRYTLPYASGLIILAAVQLETALVRIDWRAFALGSIGVAFASILSVVSTLDLEAATNPLARTQYWLTPAWPLAALITALGCCLWCVAGLCWRSRAIGGREWQHNSQVTEAPSTRSSCP